MKKINRAWTTIKLKYTFFQLFGTYKKTSIILFSCYLSLLTFSILWSTGSIQGTFDITAPSGVPDNLISTVIEASIFIALGTFILLWKTIHTTENNRIDDKQREIPSEFIIPFDKDTKIEIKNHRDHHYTFPPLLDACLRWLEFDRNDFYLSEAGALDIPKLTLMSISRDEKNKTITMNFGASDYFNIFYTHYSPDLALSNQSITEKAQKLSLRSLFSEGLRAYYYNQITKNWVEKNLLITSELLPNPIGVSGIVVLTSNNTDYVLLRKRGSHEIAAKNRLEWSFAGLIEATDWFHNSHIDFTKFSTSELKDEVFTYINVLEQQNPILEALGLVINPLYLYQPELFVLAHYKNISSSTIDELSKDVPHGFLLVKATQLEILFQKRHLKNLCKPGLKLLEKSHPEMFIKSQG